jgi:small subunit ribosomal protein S20
VPHTTSAWKRLRQTEKRRARNKKITKALKLKTRSVRETISSGDLPKAEGELKLAIQKLDQAAAKRYIHPNKAARLKSRLTKRLELAKKAPPKPAK